MHDYKIYVVRNNYERALKSTEHEIGLIINVCKDMS